MLILVRHGESTGNAEGRLLGRTDSPLTDRGLTQARSLAEAVAGATRLISSPLARARDTAEALGTGLDLEVDERWIEVDYGEYDGRELRAIPGEAWAQWRADPNFTPPGGESLAAAGARAGVASHSPSIACTTASDAGELWLDDGAGGSPATYAYSAAYAWSPVLRAWVFTDHRLARASQAA